MRPENVRGAAGRQKGKDDDSDKRVLFFMRPPLSPAAAGSTQCAPPRVADARVDEIGEIGRLSF